MKPSFSANPFGSPMSARSFNANSSRYGFNGMEKDEENNVNGGSYDFGARIYDTRLGRWLTIDPLQAKYPELSPYNFTGNNPTLFVDRDGKDYGVYVNHSDKTIIVKATLYSTKEESASAQAAALSWNSENGKYQYKVGSGSEAKFYDIKFEITVKEPNDYSERDDVFAKDKSGEANRFDVVADGTVENGAAYGITTNVLDGGRNDIAVEKSSDSRKTGSHEVGHALGLGHWSKGLMKGQGKSITDTEITKGNVTQVLSNVGIGFGNTDQTDKEVEAMSTDAKYKVSDEKGTQPTNFDMGEVVEKK